MGTVSNQMLNEKASIAEKTGLAMPTDFHMAIPVSVESEIPVKVSMQATATHVIPTGNDTSLVVHETWATPDLVDGANKTAEQQKSPESAFKLGE